jgi:hypothetical protein
MNGILGSGVLGGFVLGKAVTLLVETELLGTTTGFLTVTPFPGKLTLETLGGVCSIRNLSGTLTIDNHTN